VAALQGQLEARFKVVEWELGVKLSQHNSFSARQYRHR
jgi:hypothetical protein